jgi:hypothetical protein
MRLAIVQCHLPPEALTRLDGLASLYMRRYGAPASRSAIMRLLTERYLAGLEADLSTLPVPRAGA